MRLRADGGTQEECCDGRQRRLQRLFIDVTGVDRLVEPQEREEGSRVLDEEAGSAGVSEYLTTMARDDGLAETVDEPDQSGNIE